MIYIMLMGSHAAGLQGGIHEVIVGVPDLGAAIAHWQAFGYAVISHGRLDASAAHSLYGRRIALQAARLGHGGASSGLIRLQQWRDAAGPGLGSAPLRTAGSRWTVHRTNDITPAMVWGRYLEKTLAGTTIAGPVIHGVDARTASINHAVLTPHYRHVLMVRHGIDVPLYGTPDPASLLGASEVAHAGIVVAAARAGTLRFYSLLGFRAMSQRRVGYDPQSVATQLFPLYPGEALVEHDFDDPRSLPGPGQLPGRLRAFVLEPGHESDFQTAPGDDGYNLYSLRHIGFGAADAGRHWLASLGAESLGAGRDEFGELVCRFRAPDGYEWIGLPAV